MHQCIIAMSVHPHQRGIAFYLVCLAFLHVEAWELPNCGKKHDSLVDEQQITLNGMFPWLVSIVERKDGRFYFLCGGALIRREWILSTATCIKHYVSFPNDDTGTWHLVKAGGMHPTEASDHSQQQYVRDVVKSKDLSLVKTRRPFKLNNYVNTICEPKENDHDIVGMTAIFAGWDMGWQLQRVVLVVADEDSCRREFDVVHKDQFCADVNKTDDALCAESVGSALYVRSKGSDTDNRYTMLGIFDRVKHSCGAPALFTNVQHLNPWIEEVLQGIPDNVLDESDTAHHVTYNALLHIILPLIILLSATLG